MVQVRARGRHALVFALAFGLGACGGEDDGETPPGADGGADAEVMADGTAEPEPDMGVRCVRDDQCPEGLYCPASVGGMAAVCVVGCREGGCAMGERCNTEAEPRFCERDPSCAADADCFPAEYCDGALCQPGCRTGDPEACPRTMNGEPRACDPETRACVIQVVCCGGDDACSLELPDACDDPIPGLNNCINPNPCALRCEDDDDCEDPEYCAEGFCAEGCRLEGPGCGQERVCDSEERVCRRPPCAEDDDCRASFFCSVDVCLPGCRRDPDTCPRGEICDEANRCVPEDGPDDPCRADAECDAENPGWICEDGVCEPPCLAHADCADDLACIDGRCVEGCRDDDFEDNDVREDAPPLRFDGNRFDGEGFYACRRDADWYRFETPSAGTSVRVTVRFTHADGDLDARLHAPDGRVVGQGVTGDDDELIEYIAGPGNPSPAGTWWVEVYARGIDENRYDLTIELSGGIGPDAAEPDDAPVTATSLSLPELQQSATIEDRTIHPADEDWFALDMGARDGLRLWLELLGNDTGQNSEMSFEIFGPGAPTPGEAPVAGPNGGGGGGPDGPRFLAFDAPRFNAQIEDGRYYIRVFGADRSQFGRYRLTVTVDRNGVLCLPDASEPNDVAQTAFDLMTVPEFVRPGLDGTLELRPDLDLTLPGRTLCDEEDWYSLTLRPGDALEVRATRLEPDIVGDTIIELRDPFGGLIQSGRSGQRVNVARFDEAAGGRYLVRVQAAAEVRTGYDLDVLRTAGPVQCAPDVFDGEARNDDRGSAAAIDPGAYAGLTLCGADGDADWFRFEIDTLAAIEVALRFAHVQGDLELDLFFEDDPVSLNAELPDGHSADDDEVVRFENRAPGVYYVRVGGLGDPTAAYDLELTVDERIFVCEDDPDEPNAAFDDAELLGRNEVDRQTQWLCVRAPQDWDTFLFTVPPGEARTVATSFVYGDDGDLYLEVFDSDEMLRATTADVARGNSKQCVVIEASDANRTFFARVLPLSINTVGEDDERLDYRLRVAIGDDCEALPPATPGVNWPRVVE